MANIKSAIKRIKTNRKAAELNRAKKSEFRTLARKTREAVKAGEKDLAQDFLKQASRKLDKAAGKNIIHKNQAANRKAALAKLVNEM